MSRCNKSHYAWLAFISKKPRSGDDINKILERTSRWYGAESNAHIYPLLKKWNKQVVSCPRSLNSVVPVIGEFIYNICKTFSPIGGQ